MALDGLGGDGQLLGDVLVGVAARNESKYLALSSGQLVEVRIGDDKGMFVASRAEGVEDEAGRRFWLYP